MSEYYIGVDLGGTNIAAGIVDKKGEIICKKSVRTNLPKPEAELENDLGINSLELADLVLICEEEFEIEIDDENLHKLVTVGDVVNYLESL